MTKSEFVDQVADRAGLSKKDAGDAVDAVLETIEDALKRGSDVTFSGFGKFSVSQRRSRSSPPVRGSRRPSTSGLDASHMLEPLGSGGACGKFPRGGAFRGADRV